MPIFTYKAKSSNGKTSSGEIEAASRKLALQRLSSRGLRPLVITEKSGDSEKGGAKNPFSSLFSSGQSQETIAKSLNKKIALPFLTSIKELLACGIQAGDALRMLSVRLNDPRQKCLANLLWDDLRQGRSLSEALKNQPAVFEESAVNLIEAGEATGSLNMVLDRIVSNMEARKAIQSKLASALAYPLVLILICIGLVLLFLFYLLPKIQDLLDSLGSDLPLPTRILIGMSEFMLSYGWIIGLGMIAGVVATITWRKTTKGRLAFDAIILRIPGLGRFLRDTQVLKVTQTLSLLLENGITMVQSLQMTERSVSNMSMRERFIEARGKVVEGATLSSAFKSTDYFDDMVLDIFTVGENTGNIVPGLKQMTSQYNEAIDRFIKAFLGSISIGVLMIAFGFVALIAYGIISSVFQLSAGLSV
ncbi:type II secretion system F family protein [Puniceicoccaceae bacterium K14]|nr:type II secretion system F family protein [Puniceicoccaceae bacterium K14]